MLRRSIVSRTPRAEAAPHHGLQPLDCQKILRRDAACADSIVAAT